MSFFISCYPEEMEAFLPSFHFMISKNEAFVEVKWLIAVSLSTGDGGYKGWDREGWQELGAKENIFVQRGRSHLGRSRN